MSNENNNNNNNDNINKAKERDDDDIPLADDDSTEEVTDSDLLKLNLANITGPDKLESIQQQQLQHQQQSQQPSSLEVNLDLNPDEMEEKERMIQQVLELQNTLDDLSLRVESVKEENLKLKSENQVLGQYIENLVSASSVFQSTSPKTRNNKTSNIPPMKT